VNTDELEFQAILEDVESLNKKAFGAELDITKLSFYAYSQVTDRYELLTSGSALGKGVGPLLISKREFTDPEKEIKTIAIPGKHTTAYFLFRTFYPTLTNTEELVFSDIEKAVLEEQVDAGVIIHENRFTYEARGLRKIADLGDLWEKKTGLPIPLGGIAIRRSIPYDIKQKVNAILKSSVEFAFANPDSSAAYVKEHAQEMDEVVRKKHIELYVNEYSIDLGESGKNAIETMFQFTGDSVFV
jgi:1,4-dihydroxy-6-naphthoate synthase